MTGDHVQRGDEPRSTELQGLVDQRRGDRQDQRANAAHGAADNGSKKRFEVNPPRVVAKCHEYAEAPDVRRRAPRAARWPAAMASPGDRESARCRFSRLTERRDRVPTPRRFARPTPGDDAGRGRPTSPRRYERRTGWWAEPARARTSEAADSEVCSRRALAIMRSRRVRGPRVRARRPAPNVGTRAALHARLLSIGYGVAAALQSPRYQERRGHVGGARGGLSPQGPLGPHSHGTGPACPRMPPKPSTMSAAPEGKARATKSGVCRSTPSWGSPFRS